MKRVVGIVILLALALGAYFIVNEKTVVEREAADENTDPVLDSIADTKVEMEDSYYELKMNNLVFVDDLSWEEGKIAVVLIEFILNDVKTSLLLKSDSSVEMFSYAYLALEDLSTIAGVPEASQSLLEYINSEYLNSHNFQLAKRYGGIIRNKSIDVYARTDEGEVLKYRIQNIEMTDESNEVFIAGLLEIVNATIGENMDILQFQKIQK